MNANELAEGINSPHNACCYRDKCRQQQAELDSLQKNLDVALMIVNKPELTDEEIEDECRKAWGLHDQDQLNLEEVFKFARAILRKAQE